MAVLFVIYIPVEDPESPSVTKQLGQDGDEALEEIAGEEEKVDSTASKEPEELPVSAGVGKENDARCEESSVMNDEKEGLLPEKEPDVQASKSSVKFTVETVPEPEDQDQEGHLEEELERFTLEQALQSLLESLGITKDTWSKTDDGSQWKVVFLVETSECDKILNRLTHVGFGILAETSISIFSATSHYVGKTQTEDSCDVKALQTSSSANESKSEFMKSVKSRLTVAQVVVGVQANSQLTFDFIMLVILASFIAALGLAENSSVVLVASMLVSPIMGPILGGTFGVVIKHRDLCRLGVTNELIGLGICLLDGFIFGLITAGANLSGTLWGSSNSWPTPEMSSRGMVRSLWVGILIAIPSGAGVALSILGGNAGSLVGVAISASLLPPAVNAGMLWAYALVTAIHPPSTQTQFNQTDLNPPDCLPLVDNAYTFTYSCNMAKEAGILGVVSFTLTLLNIICIFIMCVIVLKIKEVAPHTAMSSATEAFWKSDIKVAREAYKTMKGGKESLDMAKMAREMAQEWKSNQEAVVMRNQPRMRESFSHLISYLSAESNFYSIGKSVPGHCSNQPDLLKEVTKEGDEILSDQNMPRDHSYHTITTATAVHELSRKKSNISPAPDTQPKRANIYKRPTSGGDSSTEETLSPSTPSETTHFCFDAEKIRQRRKNQRRPRGPSRMLSCPGSIHLPHDSIGRFRVETIHEEPLSTKADV